MKSHDKDYIDYSHQDAPNILHQVLTYFFLDENNVSTYSLPKKHFDNIKTSNTFANARRYFTIITGTNLVTNKIVSSYRTNQGTRYLLRKDYHQLIERMARKDKREMLRNSQSSLKQQQSSPSSQQKSPFLEYLEVQTYDDNSSSDDNEPVSNTDQPVVNKTPSTSHTQNIQETTNPSVHTDDDNSTINTQLTKLATEVETEMNNAMHDMNNDRQDDLIPDEDRITTIIQSVFKSELSNIMKRLEHKENALDKEIKKSKALNQTLRENIDSFNKIHKNITVTNEKLINKYSYVTRVIDELRQEMDDLKVGTVSESNIMKKIDAKIQQIDHQHKIDQDDQTTTSRSMIQDSHEKLTRRISRLKDKSKTQSEQHDIDYDLLTDRVQRLERNFANLNQKDNIKKRLSYSSDNSKSSSEQSTRRQTTYSTYNTPPQHGYNNTYYCGPNLDYLRKNVNITCSAQNQILEFYIKFRLALEPGGIHIIPIDQITKHRSIAQDKPGVTTNNQRLQSNALFTLLSNEKIIPSDFTMAQNCILGFASTMDGFGALRAMLKLTHPTLSKKRPSNTPPVLSESNDIHAYKQNLRNYYLLHKLFSDTKYAPIEKAKQFLQGIDDGQYTDAVQRVQHQLDTIETLNVPLHEDYDIENIASTIINISGEYENTKTIVNTMNNSTPRYQQRKYYYHNSNRQNDTFRAPTQRCRSDKFDKSQCYACKSFGHTVTHCKLLPRVLAVIQFKSKYSDKCTAILNQHIRNNTVDSKRTFVRTLQNMEILSIDDDCDEYLDHDIIINTITDNGFHDRDFLSDDE